MIPRKKIWKKSKNEQKEVLQALQSDIQDMKESLQEIREAQEGASKFTTWCVLGSATVTAGLAIIGINVSYSSPSLRICGLIFGLVMFLAGMFMIKGSYAGTDLNKYPDKFVSYYMKHPRELWHTNKLLSSGLLFLVLDIFILIIMLYILSL